MKDQWFSRCFASSSYAVIRSRVKVMEERRATHEMNMQHGRAMVSSFKRCHAGSTLGERRDQTKV